MNYVEDTVEFISSQFFFSVLSDTVLTLSMVNLAMDHAGRGGSGSFIQQQPPRRWERLFLNPKTSPGDMFTVPSCLPSCSPICSPICSLIFPYVPFPSPMSFSYMSYMSYVQLCSCSLFGYQLSRSPRWRIAQWCSQRRFDRPIRQCH